MAMNSKRAGLLVILIPILILLGVGAYFAWINLSNYESGVKSAEKIGQISRLGKLEDAIAKEFNCYAVGNAECQKFQRYTDQIISSSGAANVSGGYLEKLFPLLYFVDQREQKHTKTSDLSKLKSALQTLRKKIAAGEIDQVALTSANAFRTLAEPLENRIESAKVPSRLSSDQALWQFYKQTAKSRYIGQSENILLSHYLSHKKPMPKSILQTWDGYIASYFLPSLEDTGDLGRHKETLEKLLKSKAYQDAANGIEDARIDIISGHSTGEYDIGYKQWADLFATLDHTHQKVQDTAINSILTDIQNSLDTNEKNFWLGIVLILLSLLFVILLLRFYHKTKEEDSALEQVVSNIQELSLEANEDDTSLIPPMPRNLGDKKAVYAYLESLLKVLHEKEQEAKEANEAKSQFLANMSHELRTPLNGIVGFTQILKDTKLDSDQREFVSIIENSSQNLLDIINDILDISKIAAHKMELDETHFDLFETVESVIDMLTARAEQKDIILGVYIDPALESKRIGDSLKIKQVLTNLVGNAIKFTPTYGSVSVLVTPDEEDESGMGVKFCVKDTGIGISKEDQEKIFDAFTQVDDSMNRKFGGTGLGLALSSQMVSLMGGKLSVESLKGSGSTFFFTLQLSNDESAKKEQIMYGKSLQVGLALPNRNIHRDIDRFREQYCRYLGHSVTFYYYDDIFRDKRKITLPDVMIFDHHYARMDGELEMIGSLPCSKILITKPSLQNRIHDKEHLYDAVMIAPVTFRKVYNAFTQLESGLAKRTEKINTAFATDESFKGKHALVAEDNPINQKLIVNLLQKFGMDVTVVDNGKEAVEKVVNDKYDIIFMDIQMPVMGGLDATEEIKAYEAREDLPNTPVVALTANALAGDKERYLKAGMDDYLAKPIVVEKLSDILSKYFKDETVKSEEEKSMMEIESPSETGDTQEIVIDEYQSNKGAVNDDVIAWVEGEKEKGEKLIDNVESTDILLYRDNALSRTIYQRILEGIGMQVDILVDKDEMIDALENKRYRYVLYDAAPFQTIQSLLIDVIESVGAEPIIFCDEMMECDAYGCKSLRMDAEVGDIKKVLGI